MLTIIAAMEEELAGVRTALAAAGDRPGATAPAPACHVIGVGRKGVEASLRGLLPTRRQQRLGAEPPAALLLLGFAGAGAPSLSTGDLTLAGRYCRLVPQPEMLRFDPGGLTGPAALRRLRAELGAGPAALPRIQLAWPRRYLNPIIPRRAVLKFLEPDPAMLQRARVALAQEGLTAVETDSMTVEELITDAKTKQELHRQFQAGTVNMEDYWVARSAAAAQVPFLSVRAVLDTADQGLPSYLMGLSEKPGWAAIPWRVPNLLRVYRQMRQAQESLARFAVAFLSVPAGYPSTNQSEPAQ